MKRTYKLIGHYWDHMPLPNTQFPEIAFDPTFLPIGLPPCLFDFPEKNRCISLSTLLAVDSEVSFDKIVNVSNDCATLAVVLDCQPHTTGSVYEKFFTRRSLQAINHLANRLKNTHVVLMSSPKDSA